ncbi:MerR family transcriptional regulator [Paenibacillus sp. XY044]|uniref:MerR family transcriptional regulator n=1 Tax=Paenibacillus sp. XY044 TaxID=2026089 RepID=UPI000B99D0BD|nr:MerR family transcriptional regulator [Paenibacillus sp. XY044]OZB91288.1 MerR family transcriptional regulator [Paenibacillus sp. XY044]
MKISELSRITHVSVRSIRHYENQGLLSAHRLDNDYRDFDETAVGRVKAIQLYLKLGLTVEEIRALFRTEVADPDEYEYCEEMLATYEGKLQQVNEQIEALHGLRALLERQISFTNGKRNIV